VVLPRPNASTRVSRINMENSFFDIILNALLVVQMV
jgi:hypothetical protein